MASVLFRKNPWLPAAATVLGGLVLFIGLAGHLPFPIALGAELFLLLAAYTWGYAERSQRRGFWPLLSHLRRSEYAATWDALASSREAAGVAVSGKSQEEDIRSSAALSVQNLRELISIGPQDDVLEVGCGLGRIGMEIAPVCRSWIGTDVSRNMLRYAAGRLSGVSNARLQILRGDGLAEFPARSVDVVYATNMLAHLDEIDRWNHVREAFRILRPGGRIFLDNIDLETDEGWSVFCKSNSPSTNPERPPYLPRPSTAGELTAYAIRAGFDQVQAHRRPPLIIVTGVKPAGTMAVE